MQIGRDGCGASKSLAELSPGYGASWETERRGARFAAITIHNRVTNADSINTTKVVADVPTITTVSSPFDVSLDNEGATFKMRRNLLGGCRKITTARL